MRLYLSSFRIGDHPERLLELAGPGAVAAVITNACDVYSEDDRRQGVERELAALRALGLEPHELDLRNHFGQRERLRRELQRAQLIWVRGGNTFVLRHALAESGADELLADLLRRDAVAYGGYSAGACVLAPSLRGLELADEPDAVTRTYGVPPLWDGLGVIPYAIVPHYRSPDHPETEMCERLAEYYAAHDIEHRKLRDGQAIVVEDGNTEIV